MPSRSKKSIKKRTQSTTDVVDVKCAKVAEPPAYMRRSHSKIDVKPRLESIQDTFCLKVPNEFVLFYEFCRSLNEDAPLDVFVKSLNLRLVGPFELFHQPETLPKDRDVSLCYRYFHDPPELVTIMIGSNGWHMGYFRDSPNDKPFLIVESKPKETGTLKLLGTSLFSVIKLLLNEIDSSDHILSLVDEFLAGNDYVVPKLDDVIRQRTKRCVCSTLNGFGLVVPLNGDIGYRPLRMTYSKLNSVLQSVLSASDEETQLTRLEPIDQLITFSQFACDEGDFGQAIELGLCLLAFHPKNVPLDRANILNSQIKHLLSVGYDLAGRPEFSRIIVQHMKSRSIDPPSLNDDV